MGKTTRVRVQNIQQALTAATSSINLAKRLLSELEHESGPSPRELPGEFGIFDGRFAVTEGGEKHPVPENYASKSKLVCGDKLKRIVQDGEELFKQVARVRREEVPGVLAKKDGRWHVVTSHGSYEVLASAVKYWDGNEGDEAVVVIPQEDKRVAFGALKGVVSPASTGQSSESEGKRAPQKEKKSSPKKTPTKTPTVKESVGKEKEEKEEEKGKKPTEEKQKAKDKEPTEGGDSSEDELR